MVARLLSALFLLAAAAPPLRAAERVEREDYPAPPGATLKLDTYRGGIDVRDSPDDRIHVEIYEDPGTDDPAEMSRILGRLQIARRQEGTDISIVIRNETETGVRFVWQGQEKISLSCILRVPRVCNLDLATNDGGVSVDSSTTLVGRVRARAHKGTVFFRFVDGDIVASTDNGDMVLSRCQGSVDLKAYVGNIRIGTVRGRAVLRTINGNIELQHPFGGVEASAEAGDITVELPRSFDRESSIRTNSGAITVRLDPAAHCLVRASSVWGHVRTALPFAVESGGDGKRSLVGRLNGGGALLVLHANGGQVRIDPPRI